MKVNQRQKPPIDGLWVSIGEFEFGTEASVRVSNLNTDGYVIADGVQWLSVE